MLTAADKFERYKLPPAGIVPTMSSLGVELQFEEGVS